MGSPYFMAPEQANDAKDVDHRVDIYSLGLTLLYLLTGRRPFDGNTPFSIVLAHASKPLPRGAELGTELPSPVEGLIQRMAAKQPEDRHADYDALLEDLRRVKAGQAPAIDLGAIRRKYLSWQTLIRAAAAAAVIGSAAWFLVHRSKPNPVVERSGGEMAVAPTREERPVNDPRPAAALKLRPERELDGPPDDFGEGLPPDPGGERLGGGRRDGGGETVARLLGRLPRPTANPLEEGPVDKMLAEADAYAAAHPQNYRDLVDRYRQVSAKARGTPQAREVNDRVESTIERHQTALRKVLNEYESKMDALLQARKPQEAYDLWKSFPQGLRTFESDQQIAQILEKKMPPDFLTR